MSGWAWAALPLVASLILQCEGGPTVKKQSALSLTASFTSATCRQPELRPAGFWPSTQQLSVPVSRLDKLHDHTGLPVEGCVLGQHLQLPWLGGNELTCAMQVSTARCWRPMERSTLQLTSAGRNWVALCPLRGPRCPACLRGSQA